MIKTKFNIYRLNRNLLNRDERFLYYVEKNKTDLMISLILFFKEIIMEKSIEEPIFLNKKGFQGFLYTQYNKVNWSDFIIDVSNKTNPLLFKNMYYSYILFFISKNSMIYVMTGGKSSSIIRHFIDINFGLNFLPKIVKDDTYIVSGMKETHVSGRRNQENLTNKAPSMILQEKQPNKIIDQISSEIDDGDNEFYSILVEDDNPKQIGARFANSISILKPINIEKLEQLLYFIEKKYLERDQFILNHYIPLRNTDHKKLDIDNRLIDYLFSEKNYEFEFLSNDEIMIQASQEYELRDENKKLYIELYTKPTLKEIVKKFGSSKSHLKRVLSKYTLNYKGQDIEQGDILKNIIKGSFVVRDQEYFLIDGQWYTYEFNYMESLKQLYQLHINQNYYKIKSIFSKYKLDGRYDNEDMYKKHVKILSKKQELIDADMCYIDLVEIADIIIVDGGTLYLIHNKHKFDGVSARDLLQQIKNSFHVLIRNIEDSKLRGYIEKLKDKNENIHNDYFEKVFNLIKNRNYHYIANFLEKLDFNTRSTYIKDQVIDIHSSLANANIKFTVYSHLLLNYI